MSVIVKVEFNGELRRIGVAKNELSLEALEKRFRLMFPQLEKEFTINVNNGNDVKPYDESEAKNLQLLRLVLREKEEQNIIAPEEPEILLVAPPAVDELGIQAPKEDFEAPSLLVDFDLCRGCGISLKGAHFKCLNCYSYELCEDCEGKQTDTHHSGHLMVKLRQPFRELPYKRQRVFREHIDDPQERLLAKQEKKVLREKKSEDRQQKERKRAAQEKLKRIQIVKARQASEKKARQISKAVEKRRKVVPKKVKKVKKITATTSSQPDDLFAEFEEFKFIPELKFEEVLAPTDNNNNKTTTLTTLTTDAFSSDSTSESSEDQVKETLPEPCEQNDVEEEEEEEEEPKEIEMHEIKPQSLSEDNSDIAELQKTEPQTEEVVASSDLEGEVTSETETTIGGEAKEAREEEVTEGEEAPGESSEPTLFEKNLKALEEMGFIDRQKNIELLVKNIGDLEATLEQLLRPPATGGIFSKWPFSSPFIGL